MKLFWCSYYPRLEKWRS